LLSRLTASSCRPVGIRRLWGSFFHPVIRIRTARSRSTTLKSLSSSRVQVNCQRQPQHRTAQLTASDSMRESGPALNTSTVAETAPECGESVIIEVSSTDSSDNRKVKGSVQQLSGKSLTVFVDEAIAVAADVRVQSKDLLVLGRVLGSISLLSGKWTVHIDVTRKFAVL
jgi:hypothetical protein